MLEVLLFVLVIGLGVVSWQLWQRYEKSQQVLADYAREALDQDGRLRAARRDLRDLEERTLKDMQRSTEKQ